jgi:hypothetical protein
LEYRVRYSEYNENLMNINNNYNDNINNRYQNRVHLDDDITYVIYYILWFYILMGVWVCYYCNWLANRLSLFNNNELRCFNWWF